MKKVYVRYFILSIINSFLFLIPFYIIYYFILILLVAAGLIATIIIDIVDKTDNWKTALKILGFVIP
jgi:hypothetical protein